MKDNLVERLKAVESSRLGGELHTNWHRNPDGPEAAARIEKLEAALRSTLEALESARPVDFLLVKREARTALTSTREGLTDYPTDRELDEVVNQTFYRNRPDLRAKNTDSPPPMGEME